MCGRYTLAVEKGVLAEHFQINIEGFSHYPRYNIAPGQGVPVIGISRGKRRLALMRWGLIPRWAKEQLAGYKMINARAETIDKKPAFRDSFYRRRCLLPADGFFEWKKENSLKRPYRITLAGRPVFAFAGIWDAWTSPAGENILSCSIITTAANSFMRDIHPRMPVILAGESSYSTWLGSDNGSELKGLLQPYGGELSAYRVSTLVNSPGNDARECIERI